jgi:ATP-dependent protease ClpP protease subunit
MFLFKDKKNIIDISINYNNNNKMRGFWGIKKQNYTEKKNKNKKEKKEKKDDDEESSSTENETINFKLSSIIGSKSNTNELYSNFNHIYFNNDITNESAVELKKELKSVETQIKTFNITHNIKEVLPIYLHLTTNGGLIHSALSVVDCIKSLSIPVYTIIDGFVASAGTLISVAGEKRYMCKNAYLLIHELRSGVWGKMSEIEEEYKNLKKLMEHLIDIYVENTNLTKKQLNGILKKDVIWNIDECIKYGIITEVYE